MKPRETFLVVSLRFSIVLRRKSLSLLRIGWKVETGLDFLDLFGQHSTFFGIYVQIHIMDWDL